MEKISFKTNMLHDLLGREDLLVGNIIITEVLQGFKSDKDFKKVKELFESFTIVNLLEDDLAIESANNFRKLRKKGITIRKTIDVIIATYCIRNKHYLLHNDKDFQVFEKFLGLKAFNYN